MDALLMLLMRQATPTTDDASDTSVFSGLGGQPVTTAGCLPDARCRLLKLLSCLSTQYFARDALHDAATTDCDAFHVPVDSKSEPGVRSRASICASIEPVPGALAALFALLEDTQGQDSPATSQRSARAGCVRLLHKALREREGGELATRLLSSPEEVAVLDAAGAASASASAPVHAARATAADVLAAAPARSDVASGAGCNCAGATALADSSTSTRGDTIATAASRSLLQVSAASWLMRLVRAAQSDPFQQDTAASCSTEVEPDAAIVASYPGVDATPAAGTAAVAAASLHSLPTSAGESAADHDMVVDTALAIAACRARSSHCRSLLRCPSSQVEAVQDPLTSWLNQLLLSSSLEIRAAAAFLAASMIADSMIVAPQAPRIQSLLQGIYALATRTAPDQLTSIAHRYLPPMGFDNGGAHLFSSLCGAPRRRCGSWGRFSCLQTPSPLVLARNSTWNG